MPPERHEVRQMRPEVRTETPEVLQMRREVRPERRLRRQMPPERHEVELTRQHQQRKLRHDVHPGVQEAHDLRAQPEVYVSKTLGFSPF